MLVLSVLSMGVGIGSIAVLRSPWTAKFSATFLARLIEARTGESAVIGAVVLEPLKGRVVLDGVVLSHPGAPPGEGTIAAIEQIEVLASLRGGRPRLETLTIVRPSVRLHIDEDGLREFRALRQSPQQHDVGDGDGAVERFPWEQLTIEDATVTISSGADTRIRLPDIDVVEAGGEATISMGEGLIQAGAISQTLQPTTFSDVSLSPQYLQVPNLRLRTEAVSVSGSGAFAVGGAVNGQLTVEMELPLLTPLMAGQQQLNGLALVEVDVSGHADDPTIEGAVLLSQANVMRTGRRIDFGDTVTAGWQIDGNRVLLEPVIAHWASGLVEIWGHIDLDSNDYAVSMSGEGLQLEEALILAGVEDHPWVGMTTDAELQLSGNLRPFSGVGSVKVAGLDLTVATGPVSDPRQQPVLRLPHLSLDGAISFVPSQTQWDFHEAVLGRSRARIKGVLDHATAAFGGALDLYADFSHLDLRDVRPMADLNLTGHGPSTVSVAGPLSDLSVSARVNLAEMGFAGMVFADQIQGDVLSPDLHSLHFPGMQARLGESIYDGQLTLLLGGEQPEVDLQVLLRSGTLADLIGVSVDIDGVNGAVDGVLSLHGPVDALDGEVRLGLDDVVLLGESFSAGEAVAWMDSGRFTLEQLELRRTQNGRQESLFARGSVGKGYATNIEVMSSGIRLEGLTALQGVSQLRGDISLDARLGGTLQSLEPRGRLAISGMRVNQRPMPPSSMRFSTRDGVLHFDGVIAEDAASGTGMDVAGTFDLWTDQHYDVVAEMTAFPLNALYPQAPDGSPITALATGALLLSGALPDPAPSMLRASISDLTVDWQRHRLRAAQEWTYDQQGHQFSLHGLELVDEQGATAIRFGGSGQTNGQMWMAGEGEMELSLLRMVVPGLQRADGMADLSLSIARPQANAPTQTAIRAETDGALIEGTWFPHPIEELAVAIEGAPDGYRILQGSGRIGGGALSFQGQIDAQQWVPSRYDVRSTLQNARVHYLDFLPPVTGDANLAVNGPADNLLLSGTIHVDEMLFAERIDWESWVLEVSGERLRDAVAEETEDLFAMDIRMVANDSIRMRNNVANLTAGGQLLLRGTTARPGMTGTIRAQPGGTVFLKERNFELQRAELTFVDPYTFDPDVDIAMSTTVNTREQDIGIEYLVQGQYSDWYAETRSDPPMSAADINALLLFGLTLEELERYGGLSSALVVEGGDLLASKFGIVQQVGEGIFQYDLFRLDRVDLISGVNARSYSAVTSELRLLAEKDLDWGPTLRLEQNLNRVSDTYISLEQKLARRLYLRGFYATEQQDRYLTIGGAYGVDMNVRWELD